MRLTNKVCVFPFESHRGGLHIWGEAIKKGEAPARVVNNVSFANVLPSFRFSIYQYKSLCVTET